MARLYLVRHAQASLLSDDYDLLLPLGVTQAPSVRHRFAAPGEPISVAVSGSLKRPTATASACLAQLSAPPPLQIDTGFDEYSRGELFGMPFGSSNSRRQAMQWSATAKRSGRSIRSGGSFNLPGAA